jgi:hypothetical protein
MMKVPRRTSHVLEILRAVVRYTTAQAASSSAGRMAKRLFITLAQH